MALARPLFVTRCGPRADWSLAFARLEVDLFIGVAQGDPHAAVEDMGGVLDVGVVAPRDQQGTADVPAAVGLPLAVLQRTSKSPFNLPLRKLYDSLTVYRGQTDSSPSPIPTSCAASSGSVHVPCRINRSTLFLALRTLPTAQRPMRVLWTSFQTDATLFR